jgi:hypothetical protein
MPEQKVERKFELKTGDSPLVTLVFRAHENMETGDSPPVTRVFRAHENMYNEWTVPAFPLFVRFSFRPASQNGHPPIRRPIP